MMKLKNKKVFFDTDYLSSFLRIERTDLILEKYGKILISEQVKNEICNEGNYPKIKQRFQSLYDNGDVEVFEIIEGSEEWDTYLTLRLSSNEILKNIGEMSIISLAKAKNGILASNNLTDICEYVKKFNLEYTTTANTLVECFDDKTITCNEVKSYWRAMTQFGIKIPRTSFENFYRKHGDPCDDFENHLFN